MGRRQPKLSSSRRHATLILRASGVTDTDEEISRIFFGRETKEHWIFPSYITLFPYRSLYGNRKFDRNRVVDSYADSLLRADPCKYWVWPCKIEKSNVLKLFLGITPGPPRTETAIWIALGNYFFSYLTLLFWCVPAGKINWKLGFLRGLVRTNATVDRNTNYFIPLLRYWSLFSVVLIRIRFKWELWHIF